MEPVTYSLFQAANLAFQNRNKLGQAIRWLQGDKNAFETPEQKIEKLKLILEEVIESQQIQDEWLQNVPKVFIRLWIAFGVTLLVAITSLGLTIYLLATR